MVVRQASAMLSLRTSSPSSAGHLRSFSLRPLYLRQPTSRSRRVGPIPNVADLENFAWGSAAGEEVSGQLAKAGDVKADPKRASWRSPVSLLKETSPCLCPVAANTMSALKRDKTEFGKHRECTLACAHSHAIQFSVLYAPIKVLRHHQNQRIKKPSFCLVHRNVEGDSLCSASGVHEV